MGRVLRGDERSRIPALEHEANGRADAIVADARARALGIEAAARTRADAAVQDATESALRVLDRTVQEARASLDELFRQREAELVELALGVGASLARGALEAEPARVAELLREAVSRLPRGASFSARVHPDDAAALASTEIALRPDPTLERGDVVVESSVGRIDARLTTRIDAIRKALQRS